ncbi:MAG: hypothetical protein R2710_19860 [Acidimicrobiales bacterium]
MINKVDRPDARIADVVDEVYELFLDIDARDDQIEFPIVYCAARDGWASLDQDVKGENLEPLFELMVEHIPAPPTKRATRCRHGSPTSDSSPYLGRLALCRIMNGTLTKGQSVSLSRVDVFAPASQAQRAYPHPWALTRVPAESAGPGDLAVAGIEDIPHRRDPGRRRRPRPMPVIEVDQPSLSMTIGINTSPLAGQSGSKLTARLVKGRIDSGTGRQHEPPGPPHRSSRRLGSPGSRREPSSPSSSSRCAVRDSN